MHWLRPFVVVFQEIQLYDVGRQGVEIYPCIKVCFLCQLHAHTYAIKAKTVFLWFFKKYIIFQEIQCLHNFNHDDVRHVTELYLSTKFHVCQCLRLVRYRT